jgi:DNA-binding transcriptional regulator GbsR (MarR family)
MRLTPIMQRYIVHWGEMGTRWGINRSVAQIHALLYLSPQPIHADEIAETLGIARSNVSVGLKELVTWKLVHVTQTLGDRRDFFVALRDPWEVVRVIVAGRKQRELDPTVEFLKECALELDSRTAGIYGDLDGLVHLDRGAAPENAHENDAHGSENRQVHR